MKKQKPTTPDAEEQAPIVAEAAVVEKVTMKKRKKTDNAGEQVKVPQESVAKTDAAAEKTEKTGKAKAKKQKAPKEEKSSKFLLNMKKTLRKSVKKQAAETGISMNEYIVAAVIQKLEQDTLHR